MDKKRVEWISNQNISYTQRIEKYYIISKIIKVTNNFEWILGYIQFEKSSSHIWIDIKRETEDEYTGLVIFYIGCYLKVMKSIKERNQKEKPRRETWGTLIFKRENKEVQRTSFWRNQEEWGKQEDRHFNKSLIQKYVSSDNN